jgi:hypothetical protein
MSALSPEGKRLALSPMQQVQCAASRLTTALMAYNYVDGAHSTLGTLREVSRDHHEAPSV